MAWWNPKAKLSAVKKDWAVRLKICQLNELIDTTQNLALNSIHSYDISFLESGVLLAESYAIYVPTVLKP